MLDLLFDSGYGATARAAFFGEGGPAMAVAASTRGGAPVAAESSNLAVTGADGHRAMENLDGSTFDFVVLRHTWSSPPEMTRQVGTWSDRLAPGGVLFIAEPDLALLVHGSPVRYPAGLWLRHLPDLAADLALRIAGATRLGPALVSARLRDVAFHHAEEDGPEYPNAEAFWKATRPGLPDEAVAAAAADFSSLTGPLVDRRPWNVATGVRPG